MSGEQLLIKMWETIAKDGISSLASPWQIKREGKAFAVVRRNEMLMLAQTEMDANEIKLGKKKLLPDGKLIEIHNDLLNGDVDFHGRIEPILDLADISEKVSQQKKAHDLQEEVNLSKTIILAEDELLRSNQEPSNEEVDPDWYTRWRENAKSVRNDELRRIWARTLAGEVKSPGTYSLRTLDLIKNLSQADAVAISKLGQFSIRDLIIKCAYLKENGIEFEFLLHMDDLGIMSGVQGGEISGLEFNLNSIEKDKFRGSLISRNKILLIESDDPSKKLSLPCYKLTKIGAEILSLGDFNTDDQYMREIGVLIKNKGFDVKLATCVRVSSNSVNYSNAELL
jgi:Protein of unknown function (DUF2806)